MAIVSLEEDLPVGGLSLSSLIVIATSLLVAAKVALLYISWQMSPLNKIPGPSRSSFWTGFFFEIQKQPFMVPHMRWLEALRKNHGDDLPLLHHTGLLGQQNLLVLDKTIVHRILSAPECSGRRDGPRYGKRIDVLRSRIGDGLVTLEGRNWMRHRRIIQPSFHTGILRERLEAVVPPVARRLVACWRKTAGSEIDASSHLSAATLDVVGIVLFSHDFGATRTLEEWAEAAATARGRESPGGDGDAAVPDASDSFVSSFMRAMQFNYFTIFLRMMGLAQWEPILNPPFRRNNRMLNKAVDQVLQNAKEQHDRKNKSNNNGKDDGRDGDRSLLHLLFEAQDPSHEGDSNRKLSWGELRDETKTFLMAGHETTSTWLYFVMLALARHPDVQEKLHRELAAAGRDGASMTLGETEDVAYLDAVMNEVLRLYTPVGMIVRFNNGPETLAGYAVPPSTRLTVSMFLLHRHPAYWDDPESFLPERWIDPSPGERERRRHAFLPFSAGGRNCIGQRFAWMEARLLLVPIVRSFVVRIAPSQRDVQHTFTNRFTMKVKPSLKIVVKPRH